MLRTMLLAAAVAALPAVGVTAQDKRATALEDSAAWQDIRYDVVGDGPVLDGAGLYALDAPFRAEDAATVPVRFTQAEGAPDVRRMTLVIDENPAPVAAEFVFGPGMQPVDLETRVRVDAYSNLRAIVETTDGTLYMTGGFVRASGGCSAPASKDAAAALAALGQMKVRWFEPVADGPQSGGRREAQVMLRHPNYSGMQRDQITHLFVPPQFIDVLEVRQGGDLLFSMTGGISISEDPTFRFAYTGASAADLTVTATDTDGQTFEERFPLGS